MEDDSVREAIETDAAKRVKELLDNKWLDPTGADRHGWTALMTAAALGAPKCLALLLPLSDPRARTNMGMTPLMWAALSGKAKCVEMLIPVSDLSATDDRGRTALAMAQTEKRKAWKACAALLSQAELAAKSGK